MHMLKVSLLSPELRRLGVFTAVHCPKDDAVVLLTLSAQVCEWLAAHDVWAELAPNLLEGAQFSRLLTTLLRCCTHAAVERCGDCLRDGVSPL